MKKSIYVALIISFALIVTLVGVYYYNKSQMNQKPQVNSNERKETQVKAPEKQEITSNEVVGDPAKAQIVQDSTTPKNYNDPELTNLEKEVNSLDISDQTDIQ